MLWLHFYCAAQVNFLKTEQQQNPHFFEWLSAFRICFCLFLVLSITAWSAESALGSLTWVLIHSYAVLHRVLLFFFFLKGLLGKALSFPEPSFAQAKRTVLPSTILFVELSSFFPRRSVALEGRVCVLLGFAVVSVCFLFFWDRVSLGHSGCHGTHYVDKLVLNLQRYT